MTLNEIVRACFILFTPLLHILHTCGFRPSHGWICKQILNQGASSPAVFLFFRDNAPVPHESSGSFIFFLWTLHQPLGPQLPQTSNTVYANILPEAALAVRMRDQMHLKVSHERPKRSLERAYGGSRCGCSEVSFERVDEFALYSVAQSKEDEISPNFHSQLEESESVLTIPWLRLSLLQSGCALTFLLWRQVIPKH